MKKKFLALVVGATLCSLAVSGVASASCVSVTVNPSDSNMWISFDSACISGVYKGTVGSTEKSYRIASGAVIAIRKSSTGATSYTKTVPTGNTNATLDCSKGAADCKWATGSK